MALLVGLIASSLMAANGANYMLFKSYKNWYDAQSFCSGLGGQLATWSSQSEYDQIVNLYNEAGAWGSIWIGLLYRKSEGTWRMIDGDTSYCDNYDGRGCDNIPQWGRGEPNDWGEPNGWDCAEISQSRLNDQNCEYDLNFPVCEFSPCRDMVIGTDLFTAQEVPQLPEPYNPVTVPGNYFVLDFASGQQGMVFFALAAYSLIATAVAVYYGCMFKQRKVTYSKVAQFSEDERLNA